MTKRKLSKRSRIFPWVVCGIGGLFYAYEFFLRISPSVITAQLSSQFHIDAVRLGNLAAFYYYAYSPMQIPVGLLMDRYSPRRMLSLACLVCALGAYLFAIPILGVAEVGRFIVGLGSVFAFVGVLKLATIWLPPDRFALVSGLVTSLGMAGAIGGDIALTAFVDIIGWHQTIILSSVLGVFLAILMWLVIRDQVHRPRRIEKQHAASFKELFHGLLVLVQRPQIWICGIIGCFLFSPLTALGALWGIQYLKQAYHFTSMNAGFGISMIFLGFGIGGIISGWISDKIKQRRLPITIGSIFAAFFSAALLYLPDLSIVAIYALLFLMGLFSGVQVIVFAIVTELSEKKLSGTVIAFANLLIMLGGVVFQPVIGYVLDLHAHHVAQGNQIFSITDYRYALSIVPAGMILSMFLSLFLKETGAKRIAKES